MEWHGSGVLYVCEWQAVGQYIIWRACGVGGRGIVESVASVAGGVGRVFGFCSVGVDLGGLTYDLGCGIIRGVIT